MCNCMQSCSSRASHPTDDSGTFLRVAPQAAKDCMVVGLSSCHDHTVAMVVSIPEGSKRESEANCYRVRSSWGPQTVPLV